MRAGPEGKTQDIEVGAVDDSNQIVSQGFTPQETMGRPIRDQQPSNVLKAWLMQVEGVWRENEKLKWSTELGVCQSHA